MKTLREMPIGYRDDDLRAEALKWYHRSDDNKHKFIREFFNITEELIEANEDLKQCDKGCNHRFEDCLCGCEQCQNIDAYGDKYGDEAQEA